MNITRLDIDSNTFHIMQGEERLFLVEREHLKDGRRGYWLMKMASKMGFDVIVERSQYSNDLMELANSRAYGEYPGSKFRIPCSKRHYLANANDWLADVEFHYGGDWTSDYYEWEENALLIRRVSE